MLFIICIYWKVSFTGCHIFHISSPLPVPQQFSSYQLFLFFFFLLLIFLEKKRWAEHFYLNCHSLCFLPPSQLLFICFYRLWGYVPKPLKTMKDTLIMSYQNLLLWEDLNKKSKHMQPYIHYIFHSSMSSNVWMIFMLDYMTQFN